MVIIERADTGAIRIDLNDKIVLVTGPRQCGKTTLSKLLWPEYDYFNYDNAADRLGLRQRSWRRDVLLVIFDELHKMKQWKAWVNGALQCPGLWHNLVTLFYLGRGVWPPLPANAGVGYPGLPTS